MEEKQYICPICGHEVESDGYCYEDGHIHYHCVNCSWSCVDSEINKRYRVYCNYDFVKAFEEANSNVYEKVCVYDSFDGDEVVFEHRKVLTNADKVAYMIMTFVKENDIPIEEAVNGCNLAIRRLKE